MNVALAYGQGHLNLRFPDKHTSIIEPSPRAALPDERSSVRQALEAPIGCPSLREQIRPTDKICLLFTDLTRATPNERLIPWILEYLDDIVPRHQITLLNQLGTHRPNTPAELERMLTPYVMANYRVLNHEPENHSACVQFGNTRTGTPALINRHCAAADLRIVTGFIEPHFFAGFSGGPKGIMPGVAHVETVMSNHGVHHIGDSRATFGNCEGNPLWEELREIAMRVGPSFLCNVTLNEQRRITGVFAGDLVRAHRQGREFVRTSAMQKVEQPFDIVVTTNSGYPLDLNLYQGVKGMSAGARILKENGLLILAAECREGVPSGSPLDRLLREAGSPEEILTLLATPGFVRPEQWQAQIQALIQRRARVQVYSSLPENILRAAHLEPCVDIVESVEKELLRLGPSARIAVLPQGPLTIPYLA